jgi:hypothetical protein
VLNPGDRVLDFSCELLQSRLEDATFRLGVGGQRLETTAELLLGRGDPLLEGADRTRLLAFEPCGDLVQPLLEPLRAGIAHVREPLGKDGLRLTCEGLHGAIELTGKPDRGVLPGCADRVGELLPGRLGVARGRARDDALQLLDLPPLHLREAHLNSARRLRLLALDPLAERALPSPDPVVQLVEGTPPFRREGVELLASGGDALLDDPCELVTEPREPRTLLFALRLEPLGVGHDPGLGLGDQLPLPLGEPCELVGDGRAPYKREIERFASAASSLSEIIAFTVLGLSIPISDALGHGRVWTGLGLAALLILVVRPLLVGALLVPIKLRMGERAFVLWSGLKGAVPILLGTYVIAEGVKGADRLYSVIFVVVLISVVVQGGLVPALARLWKVPMRVVEPEPWALGMRFRDEPEGLHRYVVAAGSAADGVAIEDLPLGEDVWISMISREGQLVQVHGETVLQAGDEVLALAEHDDQAAALFC